MLQTLVVPGGRTGRRAFWNRLAALGIAYQVVGVTILVIGSGVFAWNIRVLLIALGLHTYVFLSLGAIVGIRRLHDRDVSGWWILLVLVPVVGSLWYLWNGCLAGSDTANRFGPSTAANDRAIAAVFDAGTPMPEAKRPIAAIAGTLVLWIAFAVTTAITVLLFQNPSR